jgi:hypothetical protein
MTAFSRPLARESARQHGSGAVRLELQQTETLALGELAAGPPIHHPLCLTATWSARPRRTWSQGQYIARLRER